MVILLTLFAIFISGITTIPVLLSLLVVCAVVFRKSWVFFLAFGLGFLLDLFLLRPLGQTGLFFSILILALFLYERKFETRTLTFVFFASFLGSIIYLMIFGYNNVLIQSALNAIVGVLFFKLLWLKSDRHSETT